MRLWRAGSSQAAILKPVLESRLVSGQNNAPVTRIIMIVGGVMMSEWESMTIELFAVREQMQEVLGRKAKGQKGRARASIADAQSMVDEVSAHAAWSSARLIFCGRSEDLQMVGGDVPSDYCDALEPLPTELLP
jgi:hypothetical protein